jgi:paraquat-inducible protein A
LSGNAEPQTCQGLGLHACHVCGLVHRVRGPLEGVHCVRCDAELHRHAGLALQRCWAYLGASVALYIPANVMPVMSTNSVVMGSGSHTILGGIAELWNAGSWELAVIVFVASIVVPLLKMVSLGLLAWTGGRGSSWARPERATRYRLVEAVGHWSMLDVLVVVLLVAMVRFGPLANVQPEPGMLAFGAVVVLTMLAAGAFDPRLIWNPRPDDGVTADPMNDNDPHDAR